MPEQKIERCIGGKMQVNLFKDNQEVVFGIRYNKHLYIDDQHVLTFSFWKWDLVFDW